jgi:GTP-binding protein
VFVVKANVKTLSYLAMRRRFFAQNGRPGGGRQKDGARGEDTVIEVPPGTVVYDAESGERLLDLVAEGDRHVLFEGGRGGKGNTHFKSSRHQTPRFSQPGEEGEERSLRIELQVIADVGFVGLPNVGKSTLLKVLTAADPKIGNYPFTTVIPNLGVMHQYDQDVVLADIPGIIEGASQGAGLGIRFLKHIARTRGLAFVVEATDTDPAETVETLRSELRQYDLGLMNKPAIVVLTKSDLCGEQAVRETVESYPALTVSAMTREGVDELRSALFQLAGSSDGEHAPEAEIAEGNTGEEPHP